MNARRDIKTVITASKADIIAALMMRFPGSFALQSLPISGIAVSMTADAHTVTLTRVVPGQDQPDFSLVVEQQLKGR